MKARVVPLRPVPGTRLPWLKIYVTDALAETQGWSNAAVGASARLLAVQWMQGTLPADPAELRRLVGASRREWESIWKQIVGKFPRVGNGRQNAALERERRDAQERHARQRAASKTANDIRWESRRMERGGGDHA